MKTITHQRGLTLIELVVAIGIFILVALAAGTLYVTIIRQQIEDRLVQDIQRDSDTLTAHLERHLASATGVGTGSVCNQNNPDDLMYTDVNGGSHTYEKDGSQITYTTGSQTENLLSSGVTAGSLSFFPTCDGTELVAVKIDATISKSRAGFTKSTTLSTTISARPQ